MKIKRYIREGQKVQYLIYTGKNSSYVKFKQYDINNQLTALDNVSFVINGLESGIAGKTGDVLIIKNDFFKIITNSDLQRNYKILDFINAIELARLDVAKYDESEKESAIKFAGESFVEESLTSGKLKNGMYLVKNTEDDFYVLSQKELKNFLNLGFKKTEIFVIKTDKPKPVKEPKVKEPEAKKSKEKKSLFKKSKDDVNKGITTLEANVEVDKVETDIDDETVVKTADVVETDNVEVDNNEESKSEETVENTDNNPTQSTDDDGNEPVKVPELETVEENKTQDYVPVAETVLVGDDEMTKDETTSQ